MSCCSLLRKVAGNLLLMLQHCLVFLRQTQILLHRHLTLLVEDADSPLGTHEAFLEVKTLLAHDVQLVIQGGLGVQQL